MLRAITLPTILTLLLCSTAPAAPLDPFGALGNLDQPTTANAAPSNSPSAPTTATASAITALRTAIPPVVHAPASYFGENCARCHGNFGEFYGEDFGKKYTDASLRQMVLEMTIGPGDAPITPAQLDLQLSLHRSMALKKPFIALTQIAPGKSDTSSVEIAGEVTPGHQVTLRAGTQPPRTARVEEWRWTLSVPGADATQLVQDLGTSAPLLLQVQGPLGTDSLDLRQHRLNHTEPLAPQ